MLSLFLLSLSLNAEILVASPDITESSYQQALTQNELTSPVDQAVIDNESDNVRPEIFDLADQCLKEKKCQAFRDNFAKLREDFLLNRKELALLSELWKKSLRETNCYWRWADKITDQNCRLKKIDISRLGLNEDQSYAVIVDGRLYRNHDSIYVVPQTKYQWKIVSSRHLPKEVWATADELENQVSLNRPYVTGGCLDYKISPEIGESSTKIAVAFDKTCVKRMGAVDLPRVQERSWIKENQRWFVPTLIILAGTAYYMQDKKIEMTSPF